MVDLWGGWWPPYQSKLVKSHWKLLKSGIIFVNWRKAMNWGTSFMQKIHYRKFANNLLHKAPLVRRSL